MYGFCPLASGSKGNALFLGTQQTRVLIDAGLSASSLLRKLGEIGVGIETIEAIFLTHEHADHIQGLKPLVQKYKIPLFANAETAKAVCRLLGIRPAFKIFSTGEPFSYRDLEILPFSIPHDTADPVAFSFYYGGLKLGVCADLGHATPIVRKNLSSCDYLYLESNHEPSMVHACARPEVYKQRVLSKQGHLSNQECADLLAVLAHEKLKKVYLAHLSQECNAAEVALKKSLQSLESVGNKAKIFIAHQEKVSDPIYF